METARPVGIGSFAGGGDVISLQLKTPQFIDVVDVYAAIYAPAIDGSNLYLFTVNGLKPLSAGLTPWKKGVRSAEGVLLDDFPASRLPAGSYTIYVLITPGGSTDAYYLWASSFTVPAAVTATASGSFNGTILLGTPTATSVRASLFSSDQSGAVTLSYGTSPCSYDRQTAVASFVAGSPLTVALENLAADTRYYYRVNFTGTGMTAAVSSVEYSFHTARPAGSTFTFTIQADSHLDENSAPDMYRRTLANIRSDAPDFHIDLGDTFMCEKHSEPLTANVRTAPDQATVNARYAYERAYFGLIADSVPLFLVNGNHEGEAGWMADGTANNITVWTTLARQKYYLTPLPDGFYSGDSTVEPFVGKRGSWYSWNWGDALFIVLEPFWNSMTMSSRDPWGLTLGSRQYQWLQQTLAASTAKYKFIFIHNLVGGLDGQMRGGIEAAPFFEWGGKNMDGTEAFSQKRAGWSLPIHQLLVKHGVTAVFHGHDHVYARQELDGIVYQEVPQPSAKNSQSGSTLAQEYHYAAGTILSSSGHIRVTVSPSDVTSRYVRAWLPASENARQKNGQIDDSWTKPAP